MAQGNESYKLFLLPAFVIFETARALLIYSAIHAGAPISSTAITFSSEIAEAAFTLLFLLRWIKRKKETLSFGNFLDAINTISRDGAPRWKACLAYAIPPFFYLVNNLLYLLGLQFTTPALLHVAILAKLPLTAVVHHIFIRRQRNVLAWLSLLVLCAGLLITNIPPDFNLWLLYGTTDTVKSPISGSGSFLGVIIGLIVAIISSFTSTYTEIVLKQDVPFWVAQFWLYAFGSLFAAAAFLLWDGTSEKLQATISSLLPPPPAHTPMFDFTMTSAVIVTTTATGLIVANILRKKDNLVKLVGTSASIVTITASQCLLIADLRKSTLTVQTVLGSGIISIATWCYHFYRQQQPLLQSEYTSVSTSNSASDEAEEEKLLEEEFEDQSKPAEASTTLEPTFGRIAICVFFVIVLVLLTVAFGPRSR